jgi:DNA-binding HxlR family transcriptional regulator
MFPGASKKMLTQHLREMEKDGLVVRKDLSGKLRHVEYFLSDSKGLGEKAEVVWRGLRN